MKPDPSLVLLFAVWRHAFAKGLAPALLHTLWRRLPCYAEYNTRCAGLWVLEVRTYWTRAPIMVRSSDGTWAAQS